MSKPETIDEYVKRIVDEAPPLTDHQRIVIAQLLRPDSPDPAPPAYREIRAHYDADGVLLFVGAPTTDLLRSAELSMVKRTEVERLPVGEANVREKALAGAAVLTSRDPSVTVQYLVNRGDLGHLMPVVHRDPDAAPLPQVKPWPRR